MSKQTKSVVLVIKQEGFTLSLSCMFKHDSDEIYGHLFEVSDPANVCVSAGMGFGSFADLKEDGLTALQDCLLFKHSYACQEPQRRRGLVQATSLGKHTQRFAAGTDRQVFVAQRVK